MLFMFCQVLGGVAGVVVANIIFDLSIISISENVRLTRGVFISEIIAEAKLILNSQDSKDIKAEKLSVIALNTVDVTVPVLGL